MLTNIISVGCTGLKAEWTGTIKTTTQFPVVPGTVVKVRCSQSGALHKGSNEVTCSSETEFTFLKEPSCSNLGKFQESRTDIELSILCPLRRKVSY